MEAEALPQQRESGKSLLVVDDMLEARLSLAALLRLSGYTVYEAPDAAQALTLLASALPLDALITDVEMPGELDGVALAEAVRRSRPHLPLVVASAADHAARVRALGALFLRKPYRPDSLLDYLERTLAP